jgi:hypothetical protein
MVSNKKKLMMDNLLNDLYGDLTCHIYKNCVIWFKSGNPVAGIYKENPNRVRLSKTEFNCFMNMFSLPWEHPGDDKIPLELILPYLKFDGGSPAIPILKSFGYIEEIFEIGIPSDWN